MIPKCSSVQGMTLGHPRSITGFKGEGHRAKCIFQIMSGAQLKNEWSQSVQTWYREWSWNILQVTWFRVEKSKVNVRNRVMVNSNGMGKNSMSAFYSFVISWFLDWLINWRRPIPPLSTEIASHIVRNQLDLRWHHCTTYKIFFFPFHCSISVRFSRMKINSFYTSFAGWLADSLAS